MHGRVDRQLKTIDGQITHLWACYRKWLDGDTLDTPDTGDAVKPWEALAEIDELLGQRHALVHGDEMQHPDDIATVSEWGSAG